MTNVVVVGCGIVGAAIAYELSQVPGLKTTVLDHQPPAQGATGAALGILIAASSQKTKGNNLRMRLQSIQRYNDWIPQLESITGRRIPFNQQGILRLCFEGEDLSFWQHLVTVRQTQGWRLQIYDRSQLAAEYPHLNLDRVIAAVYSPQDRQVDPTALTQALVAAAQQNGVTFRFDTFVTGADSKATTRSSSSRTCYQLQTNTEAFAIDWLVVAAGLGSTPLTASLQQPIDIRPVLGQAARLKLDQPLGDPALQPVLSGEDTHIVPLGDDEVGIGATVEFPQDAAVPSPDAAALEALIQRAIDLCPALAKATRVDAWSGLRPRPEGRPAPIVELLAGYENVMLATGHYRNGILLAPATAEKVRQTIVASQA